MLIKINCNKDNLGMWKKNWWYQLIASSTPNKQVENGRKDYLWTSVFKLFKFK